MKNTIVNFSDVFSHHTKRIDAKFWEKRRKIKVRFNLSRGKNYMKWKVEEPYKKEEPTIKYFSPEDVQFVMKNCMLKNNQKTAEKIFKGDNKSVCAWIMCESISIYEKDKVIVHEHISKKPTRLMYNPRNTPNWTNEKGENLDNKEYPYIYSINSMLFA